MAKSNLHIICGTCGNNDGLTYDVHPLSELEQEDNPECGKHFVYITCPNCSTVHSLRDFLELNKK